MLTAKDDPDSASPANACTVTTVAGDGQEYSMDGIGTVSAGLYEWRVPIWRFDSAVHRIPFQPCPTLHLPKS